MPLLEQVKSIFNEGIKLKELASQTLPDVIVKASQIMACSLRSGGKILSCGNGGSASDAAHFTGEMVNRFLMERDGLAAITLNSDMALITAIANDYQYQDIYSKQIKALGKKDDVLLAISTSGNSPNILNAIRMAHECHMSVIALTGKDGGAISKILGPSDVEIRVPSPAMITPRIQEIHILIIHCLCELIDSILFTKNKE